MKKALLATILAATIVCAGCSGVVFTSPLIGLGDTVREDRLVGNWASRSNPNSASWVIRRAGDRYSLWETPEEFKRNDPPKDLAVTLIGGRTFFQISADCSRYTFFSSDSKQQCYTVYIAEIGNGTLRYWPLDETRLAKDSSNGLLSVEHELRVDFTKSSSNEIQRETCVVLKGATKDLRAFLAWYTRDNSIWGAPGDLTKVSLS